MVELNVIEFYGGSLSRADSDDKAK